jgi:predicted CoA-binding protein
MSISDSVIGILNESKTIAVVGMSKNPSKAAHRIPKYLKEVGYKVIPVNPNAEKILGEKSYPSLEDVPERIDIIDIFRPSEKTVEIVRSAVKLNIKLIWLQLGIKNEESRKIAEKHNVHFIQDKCIMVEHRKI